MDCVGLTPLEQKLYDRRLSEDKEDCDRCGHAVKPVDQCECGINDVLLEEYPRHIEQLEQLATQRGERMQIMREWIGSAGDGDHWDDFLVAYPKAADWFDADGVPVKEMK